MNKQKQIVQLPESYRKIVEVKQRNDGPFKVGGCNWTIGDGGNRFMNAMKVRKFLSKLTTDEKIEMMATVNKRLAKKEALLADAGIELPGIKGYEMHYPNEMNKKNFGKIVKALEKNGLIASMVTADLFHTFSDRALSSTNPKERARAIQYCKDVVDMAYMFEQVFGHLPTFVLWPGGEGWQNHFERDQVLAIHLYADAVNQIMDYDNEKYGGRMKFAGEAKPNEPIDNILIPTTGEFLAMRSLLKPENAARFGVNPETAHEMLANESPVLPVAWALAMGLLLHYHANWQQGLKWDQDYGIKLTLAMVEAIHLMKDYGFDGFVGLDMQARTESKDVLYVVESSMVNLRLLEAIEKKVDWNYVADLRKQRRYEEVEQYVSLVAHQILPPSVDAKLLAAA